MAAIAASLDRNPERNIAGLVSSTLTITRRAALRYLRTPQLIVMATLQMSLFFLIYRYMFSGAMRSVGIPYVDFLAPGFIATGVLFSGIGAAVAVADDMQQGFVDRLRSLPIPRSSVLAARALADSAILTLAAAVTVGIAFAVGFRLHGSILDGLAAFALVILFGFAFEWVFITLGLLAGNSQAAQGMGMIVFPFAFISSAYIPVSTMPGWLQAFANHQPLTPMVDTIRALTLGPQGTDDPRSPRQPLPHPRPPLDGRHPRPRRSARGRPLPPRLAETSTSPQRRPTMATITADTEQIRAHHRSIRRLGSWTTARCFDVRASRGSILLDLLLPEIEPGEITVDLDIDRATVILLVPDGAQIDDSDLRRVGRGRIKDWTGVGSPDGRTIRLTGEMRNAEVRIHRGGIAILRLLLSRGSRNDVRRAHKQGRI